MCICSPEYVTYYNRCNSHKKECRGWRCSSMDRALASHAQTLSLIPSTANI